MSERTLAPYHASVVAMLRELAEWTRATAGDDAKEDRLINTTAGVLHVMMHADVPEKHHEAFFTQMRELGDQAHPRLKGDFDQALGKEERVPFHTAIEIALGVYRRLLAEEVGDEEASEGAALPGDEVIWIEAGVEGMAELVLRTIVPATHLTSVRDAFEKTDRAFLAAGRSDAAAMVGMTCTDLKRRIEALPPAAAPESFALTVSHEQP